MALHWIGRLGALAALAAASTLIASVAAFGAQAPRSATPVNGFAGPVSSAPRALDRDVERPLNATLHRVACAGGGTRRCWAAGR